MRQLVDGMYTIQAVCDYCGECADVRDENEIPNGWVAANDGKVFCCELHKNKGERLT